jgi:hypothetical protein
MLDMLQFDTWSNDWDYTRKLQAIMQAPIRVIVIVSSTKGFAHCTKALALM